MNKFIAYIFAALILFGVGAFIGIKLQKPAEKPTYTQADSIAKDSIQMLIDTIKIKETVWRTKIKTVRETDTVIYEGTDTTCIEIIERKNKLVEGLDSLTLALDEEARLYSDLNVIEIKRNAELSDSIKTITQFYKDSLVEQRKHYKKKLFWTNVKWGLFTTIGIVSTVQLGK